MTSTTPQFTDAWLLQPEDLQEGDIVLCSRKSAMQYAAEWIGDGSRHVGIVVSTPKGLAMASVSRKAKKGHCATLVETLTTRYSQVLVMRPCDGNQATALSNWMLNIRRARVRYSLLALSVAFLLSWGRNFRSPTLHKMAAAVGKRYAFAAVSRGTKRSYICSTIVAEALWQATAMPLSFPLTGSKHVEYTLASEADAVSVLLTRFLCTPSDIWRYATNFKRGELSGCNAVAQLR